MKAAIGAIVVLLWCGSARADEKNIGPEVIGPGATSCGQWIQARQSGAAYASESWVLGFLSAYNRYEMGRIFPNWPNIADGTDPNGMFIWLDNYCAAHPLIYLQDATIALITQMMPTALSRQHVLK